MADIDEVAPPFERWPQHLKDLDDRQLSELASDYRWLDEEAQPADSRDEFHRRREAIIAECQRRGKDQIACECQPTAPRR